MQTSLLLLAASASVAVLAEQCLPDAVPEDKRKNLAMDGAMMPFRMFEYSWDSASIFAHILRAIASEVVGYNTEIGFGGMTSASSQPGIFAVADCKDVFAYPECEPSNQPPQIHAAIEAWMMYDFGRDWWMIHYPENAPEVLGSVGYPGREGLFVQGPTRNKVLQTGGIHLEYYGWYNSSWFQPATYFAALTDIPTSDLMNCADSWMSLPSYLAPVVQFTPDPDGFEFGADGKVIRARCSDGFWWQSPACRENPETCVPWVSGSTGWDIRGTMQRAISYNMPLALAVASDWDKYLSVPKGHEVLLYSWAPAVHFSEISLIEVAFPPYNPVEHGQSNARTTSRDIELNKFVHRDLALVAPALHFLLSRASLLLPTMENLLDDYVNTGRDIPGVACQWLKNNEATWRSWLPATEATKCPRGEGLATQEGLFVEGRGDADTCAPCRSGNRSVALVDDVGETSVCVRCAAGKSQNLWGSSSCQACSPGTYQDAEGQTQCLRCPKGRYTSQAGSLECEACNGSTTTDGTGFAAPADCQCPPETYDSAGACVACGQGALCRGFGASPEAMPGYQLEGILADGLSIFECSVALHCPGGGAGDCAPGRTGVACAKCLPGMRPDNSGGCVECDSASVLPFLLVMVLALGVLVFLYYRVSTEDRARSSHDMSMAVMTAAQVIALFQMIGVTARLSVTWEDPIRSLISFVQLFNFDVEILQIECVADSNALSLYIGKLVVVPVGLSTLLVIHLIAALVIFKGRLKERAFALYGSSGMLVMGFFIAISITILAPFQCSQHPNGKWTILQYESQLCWESGDHVVMLLLGVLALSIPVGFLAMVYRLLAIFPQRMLQGDVRFLNTFSFLFVRIKPESRWFILIYLVRNLVVALVPVIPSSFWQVVLMQVIFSVSVVVTVAWRPWRLQMVNGVEVFANYGLLGLMCMAAFFISVDDLKTVAEVALIITIASLGLFPVMLVYALFRRFGKSKKQFKFFLCHHKAAAGAFARLLKMALLEERIPPSAVFIDSDNLSDLDKLFDYVAQDTETLVVISSREVLLRPWCLGEVTTAHIHKVRTFPVYLLDFVAPDDTFIQGIADKVDLKPLTENGLTAADYRQALTNFRNLAHLDLPPNLDRQVLAWASMKIVQGKTGSCIASEVPEFTDKLDAAKATTMVLADSDNLEAMSAALIFLKLLVPVLAPNLTLMPVLFDDMPRDKAGAIRSVGNLKTLVMFCTDACFHSPHFLITLMWAIQENLNHIVPVAVADNFRFPDERFYAELRRGVMQLCEEAEAPVSPDLLTRDVKTIFKKICLPLNTMANIQTLETQTRMIWQRIENNSMTSLEADSGDTDQSVMRSISTSLVPRSL